MGSLRHEILLLVRTLHIHGCGVQFCRLEVFQSINAILSISSQA